jgi:hypothetical protein
MPELTSELRRMADDAARQARPPAAAEIIRQGDRRRRRSVTRQSLGALSVTGVAGAGIALGLGLTGSASPHGTGMIRTAAFTLVEHADGTATLTINTGVLFEPSTLQSDLAQDGIAAKVTAGSFCSSDPVPAGLLQVVSVQRPQHGGHGYPPGRAATGTAQGSGQAQHSGQVPTQGGNPGHTITINPAAMPTGTELSFGDFQLSNGAQTYFTLIDTSAYACTNTAPSSPSPGIGAIGFGSAQSGRNNSSQGGFSGIEGAAVPTAAGPRVLAGLCR